MNYTLINKSLTNHLDSYTRIGKALNPITNSYKHLIENTLARQVDNSALLQSNL